MNKAWVTAAIVALSAAVATSASAQVQKSDGVMLYKQYCATCHGLDGKGGGPTAPSLKVMPTDLTKLGLGEQFPGERVLHSIDGSAEVTAHGSREMPVWGQAFRYMKDTPPPALAINRLLEYLKTLQK